MSNYKILNTNIEGKTPPLGLLSTGELAVNYKSGDEKLFIKNDESRIKVFSPFDNEQYYTKDEVNRLLNVVDPILSESLPILFIDGGDSLDSLLTRTDVAAKKVKVNGTLKYIIGGEEVTYHVVIKLQGTSSLRYNKKNFTITFYTDETRTEKLDIALVPKWGLQNKYCFKANYIDHSHARNVVSARLWSQIVAARENVVDELKASPNNGAIDGFPCKVYVNSKYCGLYTANIPKDGWMTNMSESNELQGILCGEDYVVACFQGEPNINGDDWSEELRDEPTAQELQSWRDATNFIRTSSDETFRQELSEYFDIMSLIDYYIFAYVSCGLDGLGKNQIYLTYDMQHWIASMYDMDSTWGLYWDGSRFVSAQYRMQEDYEVGAHQTVNKLYDRLKINFQPEISARYAELRQNVLSYSNIMKCFEDFNYKVERYMTDDINAYPEIPSKDTNNINQLRNFIRERLDYVDGEIGTMRNIEELIIISRTMYIEKEYQLQASFTPTNANNYNLVWSIVSGVGTINGDKFYSNEEGETIIQVLDTISNISAQQSFNITQMPDGIIYSARDVVCGENALNTGIEFHSLENACIRMVFKANIGNTGINHTLMTCMKESEPYPGFVFRTMSGKTYYDFFAYEGHTYNVTTIPKSDTTEHTLNFVKEGSKYTLYIDNSQVFEYTETKISEVLKRDLIIGGYQDVQGNYGRYWKGEILDLKIKNIADRSNISLPKKIYIDTKVAEVNVSKNVYVTYDGFDETPNFTYEIINGNGELNDNVLTSSQLGTVEIKVKDTISGFEQIGQIKVIEKPEDHKYDTSVIIPNKKWEIDTISLGLNPEHHTLWVTYKNNNQLALGNVISIGAQIEKWAPNDAIDSNMVNIHVYQPVTLTTDPDVEFDFVKGKEHIRRFHSKLFINNNNNNNNNNNCIAINNNGFFFNGKPLFNNDGLNTQYATELITGTTDQTLNFQTVSDLIDNAPIRIGSKEGNNRSSATYYDIKVFKEVLTPQQIEDIYNLEIDDIKHLPENLIN